MLFKTKDMEEDFKERIARGIDKEYEADPLMIKIALKEFMNKHHMIDLRKRLKPFDNNDFIQDCNDCGKPIYLCGNYHGRCKECFDKLCRPK